jgi:hypothetical protein
VSFELETERAADNVKQVVAVHHRKCRLDLLVLLPDPPSFKVRAGVEDADGAERRILLR